MLQIEVNDIESLLSIKAVFYCRVFKEGAAQADRHLVVEVLGEGSKLHHPLLVQPDRLSLQNHVSEPAWLKCNQLGHARMVSGSHCVVVLDDVVIVVVMERKNRWW